MKTSRQDGVAVILVLLIVALSTSIAAYIAQQQNLWQRQIEAQFDHTQARRLGIAGIDWARAILADDARSNSYDHMGEMWALRLPAVPVENGQIIGTIEDRQGLFNLNSLVRNGISSPADLAKFQRLLALLNLPSELGASLSDWIDADNETLNPGGAEDSYYLSLPTPYRAANQPLLELGELVRVKGYDTTIIARLKPFVTALPSPGAINVNFAPAEVLASIAQNMSLSDARIIVQQRRNAPFKDVADFNRRLPRGGILIGSSDIGVSSNFFWVTGRASVNNSQVVTQALLQRSQGWPAVVWQTVQ